MTFLSPSLRFNISSIQFLILLLCAFTKQQFITPPNSLSNPSLKQTLRITSASHPDSRPKTKHFHPTSDVAAPAARYIMVGSRLLGADPVERKLAAILAADVVGYSRLMAEDESGTYDALRAALAEVVLPTVRRHAGEVFKTVGDGFLAAFGSAGQALDAAVAIQDALADGTLRLRIGVNLGDVIAEDGDMFGDGVNIAAGSRAWPSPAASTRARRWCAASAASPACSSPGSASDGRRTCPSRSRSMPCSGAPTAGARRGGAGRGRCAPRPPRSRSSSPGAQAGAGATAGFRRSPARPCRSPAIRRRRCRRTTGRRSRSCRSTT